jgi:hypothetical protein
VKGGYAAKECAFIYGTGLCIIAVVVPGQTFATGWARSNHGSKMGAPPDRSSQPSYADDNVDQLAGLVTPDP